MGRIVTKARLVINAIGCVAIIAFSLDFGYGELHYHATRPTPARIANDPDQGKGEALVMFSYGLVAFIGLAATISLFRTARKWRELPK